MSKDDADPPPADTEPIPEDAFAAIGHEIRIEILWILNDVFLQSPPYRITFSDLRSRLTDDIATSQLHYHLKPLVGHFVDKSEDGYLLRPAGVQLCWALRAGIFRRPQDREPVSVDAGFECHYCQASVVARFDAETATVHCPDCEYIYTKGLLEIPLDAFADESELLEQYGKQRHYKTLGQACGVCTICGNALGVEFHTADEMSLKLAQSRNKVVIERSCSYCSTPAHLTLGTALLADPGLIEFCHEHGVDILSTPVWDLEFIWTDKCVTVRSTDPWEVALQATFDGDTLELVVDGDLNVIDRTRQTARDGDSPPLVRELQRGEYTASGEGSERAGPPEKRACLQALRRRRWPDGVTCPHCDSADTIKKGRTNKDTQRYKCHNCENIFNDLTGTIFAEHRLSLPEMFHIIREKDRKQITEIARDLGRPYNSVLNFVHEVQDALDGEAEFDFA